MRKHEDRFSVFQMESAINRSFDPDRRNKSELSAGRILQETDGTFYRRQLEYPARIVFLSSYFQIVCLASGESAADDLPVHQPTKTSIARSSGWTHDRDRPWFPRWCPGTTLSSMNQVILIISFVSFSPSFSGLLWRHLGDDKL